MKTAIARIINAGTLPLHITPVIDSEAGPAVQIDPSKSQDFIIREADADKVLYIASPHRIVELRPVSQGPKTDGTDLQVDQVDQIAGAVESLAPELWAAYVTAANKPGLPSWEGLGDGQANWRAVARAALVWIPF